MKVAQALCVMAITGRGSMTLLCFSSICTDITIPIYETTLEGNTAWGFLVEIYYCIKMTITLLQTAQIGGFVGNRRLTTDQTHLGSILVFVIILDLIGFATLYLETERFYAGPVHLHFQTIGNTKETEFDLFTTSSG